MWITSGIYKLEKGDQDLFTSFGTDTQSSRQMRRIKNFIEWYIKKFSKLKRSTYTTIKKMGNLYLDVGKFNLTGKDVAL